MESEIGKILKEKCLTIACAESCTGGLLSNRLTDVPGSSKYFKGAIVAYSNDVKISALNVNRETLDNFGAVSEETAIEMAKNVRQILNTDIGISVTGIAGPSGGSEEKPVGLVYVSVSGINGDMTKSFNFKGSRSEIKQKTVEAILVLIQVYLTLENSF